MSAVIFENERAHFAKVSAVIFAKMSAVIFAKMSALILRR